MSRQTKYGGCVMEGKHPSGYFSWYSMIKRCTDPDRDNFKYYGGRGISVCDRWLSSFLNFYEDMGPRPTREHTIDRLNSNGNYEPGNCRWAVDAEQRTTRRTNRFLEFNGVRKTVREWERERGILRCSLRERLADGWSLAQALNFAPPPPQSRPYRQKSATYAHV